MNIGGIGIQICDFWGFSGFLEIFETLVPKLNESNTVLLRNYDL